MNCCGSDGEFHRGEFEVQVRWRERKELRNMSAIAVGAGVALLTLETATIYLLAARSGGRDEDPAYGLIIS